MRSIIILFFLICSFAIQKSQAGMEMGIYSPITGDSWKSGTQGVVKWTKNHTDGPEPKTITLRLLTGPENEGYEIAILAENVDASLGAIAFEVPEVPELPQNEPVYYVQINSPEDPCNYKYSCKIVVNGTGPALTKKEIRKRQQEELAQYIKDCNLGSKSGKAQKSGNNGASLAIPVLVVPALLVSLLFA